MESESSTSPSTDVITTLKQSENEFGLSLLASTLAHEIRNPLQTIRLQLDAIARGGSILKSMKQITENLNRLESVVEKVQRMGQRYVLHRERINLQELVEETIAALSFWLSASGINYRVQSHWEGLPLIEGDRELLQQVLLNLMMNSVQAMPDGGVLSIDISETTDHACIEVRDTGCGISSDVLKVVGTPFFTTKADGHGLGIAFCKTIAALHGGSVEIESQENKGTTVTLLVQKAPITPEEIGNA